MIFLSSMQCFKTLKTLYKSHSEPDLNTAIVFIAKVVFTPWYNITLHLVWTELCKEKHYGVW